MISGAAEAISGTAEMQKLTENEGILIKPDGSRSPRQVISCGYIYKGVPVRNKPYDEVEKPT